MPLTADAISRLYARDAEALLRYFARRTYLPEVAVDLVAETFAAAFFDRHQFRGASDQQATAWLYGIARNQLADYLRRGQVEKRALARLGVDRRPLTAAEYDRIEELAALRELHDEVIDHVAELVPEQQEALRLRVVEERPYAEVARTLGISEQTARARVSRALGALRQSTVLRDLKERPDHV